RCLSDWSSDVCSSDLAIRSLGAMKIKKAQNELLMILQNSKTTAEETEAVIEALVDMWDTATRDEVARLSSSHRAGLRLLACQVRSEERRVGMVLGNGL